LLSRWSRTWLCAWPGYRVVGLCGTGLALPLFFERERRAGTSFFDVAEICVTWWSHMEERDAAMRGRSCWTRRLVLQQRRSGCGRPRKIEVEVGSGQEEQDAKSGGVDAEASWFLAWTETGKKRTRRQAGSWRGQRVQSSFVHTKGMVVF
jgi:hypothetical protein